MVQVAGSSDNARRPARRSWQATCPRPRLLRRQQQAGFEKRAVGLGGSGLGVRRRRHVQPQVPWQKGRKWMPQQGRAEPGDELFGRLGAPTVSTVFPNTRTAQPARPEQPSPAAQQQDGLLRVQLQRPLERRAAGPAAGCRAPSAGRRAEPHASRAGGGARSWPWPWPWSVTAKGPWTAACSPWQKNSRGRACRVCWLAALLYAKGMGSVRRAQQHM